jgi:hypothetical protein
MESLPVSKMGKLVVVLVGLAAMLAWAMLLLEAR